jgi:hypothetical protein
MHEVAATELVVCGRGTTYSIRARVIVVDRRNSDQLIRPPAKWLGPQSGAEKTCRRVSHIFSNDTNLRSTLSVVTLRVGLHIVVVVCDGGFDVSKAA